MDVIIFGGQSNMQGQSEALTSTCPVPGGYEYRYLTDTLVPLQNPVGEDITTEHTQGYRFERGINQQEWLKRHVAGSACYGHTNLVPEFCRAYTETAGNRVLAVPIAKGSTVIADWLPGSAGYQILAKKACAAIRKARTQETVGRICFVWLQGESDAINSNSKADYKQKITALCQALKRDVGIETFGIIRVGHFTNDERDREIMAAQDEVCLENDTFFMLTDIAAKLNAQPNAMNPLVRGHYSAKGLEILGYTAGKALALKAE